MNKKYSMEIITMTFFEWLACGSSASIDTIYSYGCCTIQKREEEKNE